MRDTQVAVYHVRDVVQSPTETVDQYVTWLRTVAKPCEVADTDNEIRAQVLQKTLSRPLRRATPKHPAWDLTAVLTEARSSESSEGAWPHCGGMSACPARGNTCHRRGNINHCGSVCRSTATHSPHNARRGQYTRQNKVHTIEMDQREHVQRTDMDDAYAFRVPTDGGTNLPHTSITTNHQRIDTGSSFNIIYPATCKQLRKTDKHL